jgi:hypothetical protein
MTGWSVVSAGVVFVAAIVVRGEDGSGARAIGVVPAPDARVGLGGPAADGATPHGGPCDACDASCDGVHDIADVGPFVTQLVAAEPGCSACAGDLDANGSVNGLDIQLFVDCLIAPAATGACCADGVNCAVTTQSACAGFWLGAGSDCGASACGFAGLTAYRAQHGAGYFPFQKTAVGEGNEVSATHGPGVRINGFGDSDPAGEDDLIEVLVTTSQPGIALVLRRTHSALRVWTTPTKVSGTELAFTNDRTDALPIGGGTLTLWVEWAEAVHGLADLHLEPQGTAVSLDSLTFHTFASVVMSLGGEDQVPSVPVDPNHGTFVVAHALYGLGYDVHIHDEDDVGADGLGPVYNKVVDGVAHRMVGEVSIFGYSHGGGSTHDLSERLDLDRAGIGVFEIVVTSYVDAVENDSDIDIQQELRRPPSTVYHANHYQSGSFSDFFLDGGPVPNSDPPPTGLNVETTPWGAGATHFQVDDFVQVRSFIETNLVSRVTP